MNDRIAGARVTGAVRFDGLDIYGEGVDPSRSRAEGGTGLGLSIVKHMAERMGGEVVAESRLGAGTTVRVTLPAAASALAPATSHE